MTGLSRPLVEYWTNDNDHFRFVGSPSPGSEYNELHDVWVTAPGDIWAVGEYTDSFFEPEQQPDLPDEGTLGLIMHWNGESWDVIESPHPGVGDRLMGITGSSGTGSLPGNPNIFSNWAVGGYLPSTTLPARTLTEHITAPEAPPSTDSFYELSIDRDMHYNQGKVAAQERQSGAVFLNYNIPMNHGTETQPEYGTCLQGSDHYPATIPEIGLPPKKWRRGIS